MTIWLTRLAFVVVALSLAIPLSCGEDETCLHQLKDGTCVGVTTSDLCGETFCTQHASCKSTFYVQAGAGAGSGTASAPFGKLADAAAKAGPGDCIAVAAGTYGPASIKGGVSLLGRGADHVTIKGSTAGKPALAVQQGKGGVLRGFTITGTGRGFGAQEVKNLRLAQVRVDRTREVALEFHQCGGLTLDHVEVLATAPSGSGGFGVGIWLNKASFATIGASYVADSAAQGVLASKSGLALEASLIKGNEKRGIAIDCEGFSRCKGDLGSSIKQSELAENSEVGLWIQGVELLADELVVDKTTLRTDKKSNIARGVEALLGSHLELASSTVGNGEDLGILLDASTAKIVDSAVTDNAERGIWVQNDNATALSMPMPLPNPTVLIQNTDVIGNAFTGLGLADSENVVVKGGVFKDTKQLALIEGPGSVTAADGIQALRGSKISVSSASFGGNTQADVLIDASEAKVSGSTFGGGKHQLVVQNTTLDKKAFANNKDLSGKSVSPQGGSFATTTQDVTASPISSMPMPLP